MAVGFLGIGSAVPSEVITNAQIAAWSGVSEQWVDERTGITRRYYAEPGTVTSDLAARAAEEAFANAPSPRGDVEAIIVATSTPDQPLPSTAALTQEKLTLPGVAAFDINVACSGFIYGLAIADGLLGAKANGRSALVVGADLYSHLMNRADRRTVSLFGDGAGAGLLGPVPDGYGIRSWRMVAHGEHGDYVNVRAGGTRQAADQAARDAGDHLLVMHGREVREYVLDVVPKLVAEVLDEAGLSLADIGRVIFHQANTRLVEEFGRQLALGPERLPLTAPRFGNTGAASVPLTMSVEHSRKPFRRGEHLLLAAAGAGMTAAAAVVTWF
jgi:3-oxoacyl-[acyl-carrier-protein] synthase-3